ncbi:MAG: hypothetical protein WBP12_03800 [Candidatus Saccharimonas sp.]
MAFVRVSNKNEVCGYGFVRRLNSTCMEWIPNSTVLPDQFVRPGLSEPSPLGGTEIMDVAEGYPDGTLQLLWHSHVNGSAHFSSTDLKTHDSIGTATTDAAHLFMVANRNGNVMANLEIYWPVRVTVPLQVAVRSYIDDDECTNADARIADKCGPFPPLPPLVRPGAYLGANKPTVGVHQQQLQQHSSFTIAPVNSI